jgi:glycosyltransferase involved in cell wall biosynthesis
MTAPEKRRVVVMLSFVAPPGGGAQHAARRVADGLRARGHDVEMWYLYRRMADLELEPGARVLLDRPASGLGYLSLPFRAFAALRRHRPDALLTFLPLAHVVGQAAAALSGVPMRVVSHRSVCNTYQPMLRIADRLAGATPVYRRIVAVSHAVAASVDNYPEAYRRKLRVVPNGVVWQSSGLTAEEARRQFGLPEDGSLVLAVGRLQEQKNYPLLIDAVAGLPGVHLVVAGGGPLRDSLMAQARDRGMADRLHLLGRVPHARLPDLHRACDAFALSSIFEGQSNALLEAMAEGKLIFASDIAEQRELVADEGEGPAAVLLPVDDAPAWQTALAHYLGAPEKAAPLAAAARHRARRYTVERMMDGFEAALCDP